MLDAYYVVINFVFLATLKLAYVVGGALAPPQKPSRRSKKEATTKKLDTTIVA